jgi:hypothetical protein
MPAKEREPQAMTEAEQFTVLREIMQQVEPSVAEKLRVAFGHWAYQRIDGMNETMLRNFLITAVGLIDRYTLVNGEFNASQRAVLAAETLEILERVQQRPLH